MKLLIADTIFPKGHQVLNNYLLALLSQNDNISEIKVLNYQNYYAECSCKIRCNYNIPLLFESKNAYLDYFFQFLNALLVIARCWIIKYDKVVFFTFDTLAFSFLRLGLKAPIYLFHHNNTDHLLNGFKRLFFKSYMNRVNHIVFADFIRDYLIRIGVDEKRIFVLSHPLLLTEQKTENSDLKNEEKTYIALGHANDEVLIQKLIAYEIETHKLETNKIKVVIRTLEKYTALPKSLEIVNGYLSQKEYNHYYSIADGVLLLYSEKFKNRFSGALLDAFSLKKVVIGRDIPIVNFFSKKYPKCCIAFSNIEDLINKLSLVPIQFDEATYDSFLLFHSDDRIRFQLNEILL